MFSPYYAATGWADPLDHCTFNVALYGPRGPIWSPGWAMTERGRDSLHRDSISLSIGSSSLSWEGDGLIIRFDEVATPMPARLSGVVRLRPDALVNQTFALDAAERHAWRPIAPRARVEAEFDHPGLSWRGQGYFDTNGGADPLEQAFAHWTWSRAHLRRDTLIHYDVEPRVGESAHLALRVGPDGAVETLAPPPFHQLPSTFWRMPRLIRSDAAEPPRLIRTLEDAPFYARSMLRGLCESEPAEIMHESLSGDRLRSPFVKTMLPYRMPRRV